MGFKLRLFLRALIAAVQSVCSMFIATYGNQIQSHCSQNQNKGQVHLSIVLLSCYQHHLFYGCPSFWNKPANRENKLVPGKQFSSWKWPLGSRETSWSHPCRAAAFWKPQLQQAINPIAAGNHTKTGISISISIYLFKSILGTLAPLPDRSHQPSHWKYSIVDKIASICARRGGS